MCLYEEYCAPLELCAAVEVNVLLGEQLYGHVVDWLHLLAQHYGLEEGVDTAEALLVAVLGYQERDTSLSQTLGILCHHVVAHNLDVTTVVAQQVFAHDVGL